MFLTDHGPRVFVIGVTTPQWEGINDYFNYRNIAFQRNGNDSAGTYSPELLIEFGGRICYDSFHNPANKTQADYIGGSIIEHEHGSVLEHAVINFAVASLPRSTQLELVRHRAGMAYSFRSTRFTDNWIEFCVPPLLRANSHARFLFNEQCQETFRVYQSLIESIAVDPLGDDVAATLKRKRIKEAARSILSNAVGSDGEVTMNARALRHVISMRSNEHADASIREFAYAVYHAALPYFPALFADATETPVSFGVPQVSFTYPKV